MPAKRAKVKRRTTTAKRGAKRAPAKPAKGARKRTAPAGPAPIPPGAYAHIELYSDDPAATQAFYTKVFGWKFQEMSYGPGMRYLAYQAPAGPMGGVMDRRSVPMPVPPVLAYLKVKDVDAATQRIEAAGGKVLQPKMEIPNVGWMAVFQDPGGVVQALWQHHPGFKPTG